MIHDGIKSEIFFTKLNKVLRPTGPVATLKLLFGRERQVDDLEHALYATGRHAFIYGDRGVGKSSLAQTVAGKLQEGKECILVGCETTSTLQSVISDIMLNALPKDKQSGHEHRWNIGVQLGGYGANIARTHKNSSQHTDISTVSSAVHALRTLEKKHSKRPFIVIDEFDQIGSQEERAQFGALVKQLGDRASEVKLIFTGIGESLMSLIGGHKSSERQLHQIKLENLSWNGRFAIIDNAFSEFNLTVDETVRFKLAGLSDGFPSYIHLMCEKILTVAHLSKKKHKVIDFPLFIAGLNDAIKSVAETLRHDYALATEGREESCKHILWAIADTADLIRHKAHIIESYHTVCQNIPTDRVTEENFNRKFLALRRESHGQIIIPGLGKRPSWYRFRENMLRGYIRMLAEAHGVPLDFQRYRVAGEHSAFAMGQYSRYTPLTSTEDKVAHLRGDDEKSE